MYSYDWDKRTGGYRLLTTTGKFVGAELKESYFNSAVKNIKKANDELNESNLFEVA